MRLADIISDQRILHMSHERLLERIRELREARNSYVPPIKEKKQTRAKAKKSSALDKTIASMSEAEREALIKILEG